MFVVYTLPRIPCTNVDKLIYTELHRPVTRQMRVFVNESVLKCETRKTPKWYCLLLHRKPVIQKKNT